MKVNKRDVELAKLENGFKDYVFKMAEENDLTYGEIFKIISSLMSSVSDTLVKDEKEQKGEIE